MEERSLGLIFLLGTSRHLFFLLEEGLFFPIDEIIFS